MDRKHFFRGLLLISLAAGVLACNLVSGVSQQVTGAGGTAAALATDLGDGSSLMATGQALATELSDSAPLQTAQAVMTAEGPGLMATAQAYMTEEGPGLMETAQAYMTEQGPGLLETAQSFATVGVPSLLETAQAVIPGDVEIPTAAAANGPADVPIMPGGELSTAAANLLTYEVAQPLAAVVEYYKSQMALAGWTLDATGVVQSEVMWALPFTQDSRKALVTLTANGQTKTLVFVTILP